MKAKERNHGLYVSFCLERVMCIAKFPDYFITSRMFRKILTQIANHYGKPLRAVSAMDCVCDTVPKVRKFPSSADAYYDQKYKEMLPKIEAAMAGGPAFKAFDLWQWDEAATSFKLVRSTLDDYGAKKDEQSSMDKV